MRPSRLVFAVVLPLAFLVTWDEPVRDSITGHGAAPAEAGTGPAAPRPDIVSRGAWHADEDLVRERAASMDDVRAVFIHHTNHPNDYDCAAVPDMLRALEADHVQRGWDDLGYNFVVDRCGTIYEGRAGDLKGSVEGAHTKGFNEHSLGIAALGTFDEGERIPGAMLESIASLAAWKLRSGADPAGRTRMVSSSDESRYDEGDDAEFDVISGHKDAYATDCPGRALYDKLPDLRDEVKRLRMRAAAGGPHAKSQHRSTEAGRGDRR
ncbi:MAG: peptidoglycan recognition protein family protein [Streptomyces sp.]|uniref:peptidoglycan recognition protein family protein n=1 Tax=Streptomyces sp. TaxID=1931 RepID=UPI003D6B542C